MLLHDTIPLDEQSAVVPSKVPASVQDHVQPATKLAQSMPGNCRRACSSRPAIPNTFARAVANRTYSRQEHQLTSTMADKMEGIQMSVDPSKYPVPIET